jgi:hypothetical protein
MMIDGVRKRLRELQGASDVELLNIIKVYEGVRE